MEVPEVNMEQPHQEDAPLKLLFSPRQVLVGAFLGGPPAAVYLMKRNFDVLDNPEAGKKTLLFGALATLVVLALLPFLPEKFPNMVLPLGYSWAAYYLVERLQLSKAQIEESPTFDFQSVGKVVAAGLLSLVGFGAAAFAVVILALNLQGKGTKTTTLDQVPSVVEQLRQKHQEKAFVVLDFPAADAKPGEDDVNLQYRVVNGRMTLLWLLISKRNIADKDQVLQYAQKHGVKLVELQEGDVRFLLSQDDNIVPLGQSLIRDYYKLNPKFKIVVIEGVG